MVFTFIKRDLVKRKLVRAGEPAQDCGHKVAGLARAISEAENLKYADHSCFELAEAKRRFEVVSDKHKISSKLKVTMARGLRVKQRVSSEERLTAHDDLCESLVLAYEAELCKDLWAPALRLIRDLEALLATSKLRCRRFSRDPASMRKKHGAANNVQRIYRGHRGRSMARERKECLEDAARQEWELQRMIEMDGEEAERMRVEAEEEARALEEAKKARMAMLVKGDGTDEEDGVDGEGSSKGKLGDDDCNANDEKDSIVVVDGKGDTPGLRALAPKSSSPILSLVAQRCSAARLQKASADLGPGVVLFTTFESEDMPGDADQGAVDQALRSAAKSILLNPSLAKNKAQKFEPLLKLAKHKRCSAHLLLVAQQEHPLLHRLVEAFQSETQALAGTLGPPDESEEEGEEEWDDQGAMNTNTLDDKEKVLEAQKKEVPSEDAEDPEMVAAAMRIQARYRGHAARVTLAEAAQPRASGVRQGPLARQIGNDDELSRSAARIQANYRGMMSRRSFTPAKSSEELQSKQGSLLAPKSKLNAKLPGFDELAEGDEEDEDQDENEEEKREEEEEEEVVKVGDETGSEQPNDEEIQAATRIQANFRGKAARRVLSTENTEEVEENLRRRLEDKLTALAETDGKLEELISNSKGTLRSRLEDKLTAAANEGTLQELVREAKVKTSPAKRLQKVEFNDPSKMTATGSGTSNLSQASKKPIRSMKTELFNKLQNRRRQNGEDEMEEVEEEEVQEWAATRIQAVHRGRTARREVEQKRKSVKFGVSLQAEKNDVGTEEDKKKGSNKQDHMDEKGSTTAEKPDVAAGGESHSKDDGKASEAGSKPSGDLAAVQQHLSFGPSSAEEERAATKIQAIHRGRQVRCNIFRKDTPTAPRDYVDKGKETISSLAFMSIPEDDPAGSDGTLNSSRSRTGFLPPIVDEEGEDDENDHTTNNKDGIGSGLAKQMPEDVDGGNGIATAASIPPKLQINVIVAPTTTAGFELTIADPFMQCLSF